MAASPPEVLRIPLGILFPLFRKVVERENGRDRTNRNAGAAVDAFHRIDIQHLLGPELLGVLLGMNAIHRTGVNTGGIFGSDAGLGNYVGHKISCSSVARRVDTTNFSKNPATGTGMSAEPQLFHGRKEYKRLSTDGQRNRPSPTPGGGCAVGALLAQKVGIVFPKHRLKGGGSSALHRVDFLNQGVNIRGHDEQIPDSSGPRIPIGARRSPRYEHTRAGMSLALVLSH